MTSKFRGKSLLATAAADCGVMVLERLERQQPLKGVPEGIT